MVFSHGVLHHVPEIHTAQREIHRVLRPGGELVVMLYARWSLNYLLAIAVVRRLALMAMYATGARHSGIVGVHLELARAVGLMRYLRMDHFMHAPPLPVRWLPLGGLLGWHLWVHLTPR
jgi:SAM-dependent methyltransferase